MPQPDRGHAPALRRYLVLSPTLATNTPILGRGPSMSERSFPVVGIGASAGGLEALTTLFAALPDNLGMALVVVSHLDPVHRSELAEMLGRHSRFRVAEAQAGETIEANRVYVIPPGQDMTLEADVLQLEPRSSHALHRPIDLFLRSLAEARGHQAIGVILSGTANDGTLGLRAWTRSSSDPTNPAGGPSRDRGGLHALQGGHAAAAASAPDDSEQSRFVV